MALETIKTDVAVVGDIRPSIDWAAVFGGAFIAAAISFILFTFGAGIGLSLTSPYPHEGVSAPVFVIALALWVVWVTLTAFVCGGYLAGRMRRPMSGLVSHQTEVRDGVHGLVVWAVGILLGAFIAGSALMGAAKTAGDVAGAATATLATGLAKAVDPMGMMLDRFLRAPAGAPAPAGNQQPSASADARPEVTRIFAANATTGDISADDRTALVQILSQQTGMSEADAKTRVDQTADQFHSAVQQARDTAEKARKYTLLVAFLSAATLAIAAAAAWYAAVKGGEHRDEARDFSGITRWHKA